MIIQINNEHYSFSKKQFQEVRRLIKKKDYYFSNDSYESNTDEYQKVMKKYNILPTDIVLGGIK